MIGFCFEYDFVFWGTKRRVKDGQKESRGKCYAAKQWWKWLLRAEESVWDNVGECSPTTSPHSTSFHVALFVLIYPRFFLFQLPLLGWRPIYFLTSNSRELIKYVRPLAVISTGLVRYFGDIVTWYIEEFLADFFRIVWSLSL